MEVKEDKIHNSTLVEGSGMRYPLQSVLEGKQLLEYVTFRTR